MRNLLYQGAPVVIILMMFLLSCAPPDPNGKATISTKAADFTETYSGSAYDGISSNTIPYRGRKAVDGLTEAESHTAEYNKLSGLVHAECTDLTSNDLKGEQAVATSNNQVRTKLTITKQGDLNFKIKLDIEGEKINHGDSITINIQANILSKNGSGIAEGGIMNNNFVVIPVANGKDSLLVKVWSEQKKKWVVSEKKEVDKDGNVSHTISETVKGHPKLPPGNYLLEFSLRTSAYARFQYDNDDRFYAKVKKLIATITLN